MKWARMHLLLIVSIPSLGQPRPWKEQKLDIVFNECDHLWMWQLVMTNYANKKIHMIKEKLKKDLKEYKDADVHVYIVREALRFRWSGSELSGLAASSTGQYWCFISVSLIYSFVKYPSTVRLQESISNLSIRINKIDVISHFCFNLKFSNVVYFCKKISIPVHIIDINIHTFLFKQVINAWIKWQLAIIGAYDWGHVAVTSRHTSERQAVNER